MGMGIMRYTRAVGAGKELGPTPVVLCSIAKKKTTDGTGYSHQLGAHEHVHAHTHNEIHKGKVGAGDGLGLTPVALCLIAKNN